jgi:peptide chain release factor subunit 3
LPVVLKPSPSHGIGGSTTVSKKQDEIAAAKRAAEIKQKQLDDIKKKRKDKGKDTETEKVVVKFKDVQVDNTGVEEVDTTREPCSMVFIGHVDAGKSTICGNLMFLNNVVDQRTI